MKQINRMKLRTEIPISKSKVEINHDSQILLLGSCFTENIGEKLKQHKFNILANPLGITYNPVSLSQLLMKKEHFKEEDFESAKDIHFSYSLHSGFNSLSKSDVIESANKVLKLQQDFLKNCDTIFISLGTAWVFELKDSNSIVNNCHKQKADLFTKRLLSIQEIYTSLSNVIESFDKDLNIVFTISPIRHIKDGMHENQLSKSSLLLAVQQLCDRFNNCSYFPSYEIMLDDLRDYRFYKADLIHPNELAIQYIWEKFSAYFFSEKTKSLNSKIQGFNSSITHKPFNAKSEQHQVFLQKLIQQLNDFQNQYSIDYTTEINSLRSQLLP